MKKVVVVAYAFPPVGGGGVQRPTKFVKYLREFGWEPVVVTVVNPSVPLLDDSLLNDIPAGVKIYRARTLEPSYSTKKEFVSSGAGVSARIKVWLKNRLASVLLPDVQVLWWPGLLVKLFEVLRVERPDCLFVTAPPFSSFIPVVAMGKFFKVPVVVDFRDEWSYSRHQWEHAVKTPLAFWLDRKLEHLVVRFSSHLMAVNASYIRNLCGMYSDINQSKTTVVTNGFDESDFTGIEVASLTTDHVNMVYAGTVWNGNSLEPLVNAVKILIVKHPAFASKLKISICGRVVESQLVYLQDPALAGIVSLLGYQDHSVALTLMFNADVLLLSMTDLPGAENIILGKTFEYIATGNHILAMVPKGETYDILEQNYSNVSIVSPLDVDEICSVLLKLIKRDPALFRLDNSDFKQFSRLNLTGRLSDTLDMICRDSFKRAYYDK